MSGADIKKRKNAREHYRRITDAEAAAKEVERAMSLLRTVAARLVEGHEDESAARLGTAPEGDYMAETLGALGRIKGRLYLERISHGLTLDDLTAGAGWGRTTVGQFEAREKDAMMSSLFRYAAGLRRAGVRGRLEIRWVPEPDAVAICDREAA